MRWLRHPNLYRFLTPARYGNASQVRKSSQLLGDAEAARDAEGREAALEQVQGTAQRKTSGFMPPTTLLLYRPMQAVNHVMR